MIRLAIRVRREQAETVLAELLELAPMGVEELDDGGLAIEYVVYGAPGELPDLPDLHAVAGEALVEISTSEIADDWQERWKAFHRPVLVPAPHGPAGLPGDVPALRLRPPWERPAEASPSAREIVIDPGQAFGTGAHASTRLCLELLLELAAWDPARGPLLDVGTGSGVLAIAAAMLGYGPVRAFDNELESVQAAQENAGVNGVEISVERHDLRTGGLVLASSEGRQTAAAPEVMLANLLRPLLLYLAEQIAEPPAHLIAGGLLVKEAEEVADAFAARTGMRVRERRESGEWAALWLVAPALEATGV